MCNALEFSCHRKLPGNLKTSCRTWSGCSFSNPLGAEQCVFPGIQEKERRFCPLPLQFPTCSGLFFCKFVPNPAELNAAALRAGLLCCHVNCACHLFTFDLAEHFMIRTKASSDFELGGDWAGAWQDVRSEGEGLQPPSAGCPPDEQRELLPGTLSS